MYRFNQMLFEAFASFLQDGKEKIIFRGEVIVKEAGETPAMRAISLTVVASIPFSERTAYPASISR